MAEYSGCLRPHINPLQPEKGQRTQFDLFGSVDSHRDDIWDTLERIRMSA